MSKIRLSFTIIIILILFTAGGNLFSQDSGSDFLPGDAFSLSVPVDIPVVAAGAALFAAELLIEPSEGPQQSFDDIFFLDRLGVFNYSSGLDFTCDILLGSSLLLPVAAVIGTDIGTITETGVMFLEAMLLTYTVKDILKDLIPRYRPYTYFGAPFDDDYMNSFPSGHTAAAFAIGSFASYVFSEMYPDSGWKIPVTAAAYTIAAATAVLRVVSGNHFITDVAAGALIGSAVGIGVPMLHKIKPEGAGGDTLEPAVGFSAGKEPALTVSFRFGGSPL